MVAEHGSLYVPTSLTLINSFIQMSPVTLELEAGLLHSMSSKEHIEENIPTENVLLLKRVCPKSNKQNHF
jgi:hypothetical protein